MAKLIQKDDLSLVSLASTFKTSGAPLTDKELYYSYAEAVTFAASDSAYVGQIVTVVTGSTVEHYSVQVDGTLKKVSSEDLFLKQLKASVLDSMQGAAVQSILATSPDTRFVVAFKVTGTAETGYNYEPYFTTLDDGELSNNVG